MTSRAIHHAISLGLALAFSTSVSTFAAEPVEDAAVEATSLLGRPLERPVLGDDFREQQIRLLLEARSALAAAPGDPEAAIWVGRRTAYLGRYREAIEIYSRALEQHPGYANLHRHRGHRYITLRRLGDAIADLESAAALIEGEPDQIEPDGLPNALGIPTGTLHTNIWYHLGLARYLEGDFARSVAAYRKCRDLADNPDMLVAASYWLYLSLRRLGEAQAAAEVLTPITPDLEIIENHDYFYLLRAYAEEGAPLEGLLDSGQDTVESATRAYGVGAWHLIQGDVARARSIFEDLVAGEAWAAFGYIAAESELARSSEK